MHLDETMLQSKTAGTLVEFIDELMKIALDVNGRQMADDHTYTQITNSYESIKKKHAKALERRSSSCRDERFEYLNVETEE